ncbi:TrkH family potassium uptake protein [Ornithinimicrobium cavernae]|uniref:TrkH family potassium uptake protein n=1 Tax=Ornithinimicrobium cavernae TaxID=2666047 RepID=UPI000D68E44A|nr:potassium transporter TrkG [Ornithinimicrobium cavernae]
MTQPTTRGWHPARLVTLGYGGAVATGTGLLLLPVSRSEGSDPDLLVAAFTTVSAVCVTGLITVDTATYWSPFGQAVILTLIHIGGLGVMALATMLTIVVRGHLGLRTRLVAQAETHTTAVGDVRRVLTQMVVVLLAVEAVVTCVLAARFHQYGNGWGSSWWLGFFHAGSAFNNAGFSLFTDNLVGFATDPVVILSVCVAVVLGGLGFPVLRELATRWRRRTTNARPRQLSLHTTMTLWGTAVLLVLGAVLFWAFEGRSGVLASSSVGGQALGAVAGSVFPRTVGFNSVDYGAVGDETKLVTTLLMFVGGGSAGTAGGIKITTLLVLVFAVVAEVRGRSDVTVGSRQLPAVVLRQALAVSALAAALVLGSTLLLTALTGLPVVDVSFEVVSAFATVGLSTGITAGLPATAQIVLMILMFVGRVGTITVAAALAVRTTQPKYHYPEERPVVG